MWEGILRLPLEIPTLNKDAHIQMLPAKPLENYDACGPGHRTRDAGVGLRHEFEETTCVRCVWLLCMLHEHGVAFQNI